MDASPPAGADGGGLLSQIDARALTSIAALALAMTVVFAIAIVGHVKHPGNGANSDGTSASNGEESMPPLVDLGVEIPTPAINLGQQE